MTAPPVLDLVVQYDLTEILTKGWQVRGTSQDIAIAQGWTTPPYTPSPTPVDPDNYGAWFMKAPFTNFPQNAGFAFFVWGDDWTRGLPGGNFDMLPILRDWWWESPWFDGATYGWAPGQIVGVAIRSLWQLDYGWGNLFIEIEGETINRFSHPGGAFDIWTIPNDPLQNVQDHFLLTRAKADGTIKVRFGGENYHPHCNVLVIWPEMEFGIFTETPIIGPPPPEPPPLPIPPQPLPPAQYPPCSTFDILYRAMEETGYEWPAFEPAKDHLWRYAKKLLSRCMASWYGNETTDGVFSIDTFVSANGYGLNYGFNYGVAAGLGAGEPLVLPLLGFEAIWEVEAQPLGSTAWERVNVVKPDDKDGAMPPRVLIRNGQIEFLDFTRDWLGYANLRVRATEIHRDPIDWLAALAPNDHIGPLFCRACELEMSQKLAAERRDLVQAKRLVKEREDITRSLLEQSRSQRILESVRGVRR